MGNQSLKVTGTGSVIDARARFQKTPKNQQPKGPQKTQDTFVANPKQAQKVNEIGSPDRAKPSHLITEQKVLLDGVLHEAISGAQDNAEILAATMSAAGLEWGVSLEGLERLDKIFGEMGGEVKT